MPVFPSSFRHRFCTPFWLTVAGALIAGLFTLTVADDALALTFKKDGTSSQSTTKKAPKTLLIDLVTQRRTAADLSDEELCLSLTSLDLVPTFNEMQARGLDCLSIDKVQPGYKSKSAEKATLFLRKYGKKHKVKIPTYSLDNVGSVFPPASDSFATYSDLAPNFQRFMTNRDEEAEFCLDWYMQIATVAENQSKNLDGSVSWTENSLRDGFVICQDSFNSLIYRALFDDAVRDRIRRGFERWIETDTPHRDAEYDGSGFFTYSLHINKMLIALELLHQDFGWSPDQMKAAQKWARARALEVLPGTWQQHWDRLDDKCKLKIRSNRDKSEVCQNGGMLQAQLLLRAGIFGKDRELVDMSFLAFHRYMSGVRPDGSNASDSTRGCTAADYNIWASQFMSDYVYLWSLIGDPLWNHRSFGRGSPKDAVEYSLSLVGNWEAINKYTLDDLWRGCGEDEKNRTQQARNVHYPEIAFAPYFQAIAPDRLIELLSPDGYDRFEQGDFTRQSGVAYEASIVYRNPELRTRANTARRQREQDSAAALASTASQMETELEGLYRFVDGRFRIEGQVLEVANLKPSKPFRLFGSMSARLSIFGDFKIRPAALQADTATTPIFDLTLGDLDSRRTGLIVALHELSGSKIVSVFNHEPVDSYTRHLPPHQKATETACGEGIEEMLIFVIDSADLEMLRHQKCVADYFRDTTDSKARTSYFTLWALAQSMADILQKD